MLSACHGESSHAGRNSATRNGASEAYEHAKACVTALCISSGSYSGLARQEPVHLRSKALWIAPKKVSSLKADA